MVHSCSEVTYVLLLEGYYYYVGKTTQLKHRLSQHFNGKGAKWTQLNKPVKVLEIAEGDQEKALFHQYRDRWGYDRVRGYNKCKAAYGYV